MGKALPASLAPLPYPSELEVAVVPVLYARGVVVASLTFQHH